jgi:hypothetical protein
MEITIVRYFFILDSERSDECIDFTMMCVFQVVFKSVGKNPEKITEKREILRITIFRQNRFFYFAVTQK